MDVASPDVGANDTLGYRMSYMYNLPLSSSPGMTISYLCHDGKGGGGGPRLNVIMTLILKKTVGSVSLSVLVCCTQLHLTQTPTLAFWK